MSDTRKFTDEDIEHSTPESVIRPIYEHEYLLSFVHDEGAVLFADWWDIHGREEFAQWVRTQAADYS